jgi:hypothetical protein
MPPSPQVKCHPYFKLRRLTPHFQIGPQAPASTTPAPTPTPTPVPASAPRSATS